MDVFALLESMDVFALLESMDVFASTITK